MSWRQVDCKYPNVLDKITKILTFLGHINNLYNTSFWALIQHGGLDNKEAEKTLTVSH